LLASLTIVSLPQVVQAQNDEHEIFLVAQKAFEDGFYDVAIRYINQLLQEFPQTEKRVQAQLLLGQCFFFKSQYLKAYDIFQKLLKENEFKDATLFWLGETYLKGTDYKEAEKHYKQLIKLFPKSEYAPQAYYSLGWAYFEQNKFQNAKNIFRKLMQNYPLHQLTEDAAFKLGETEYNLQKYEETIQYFKSYILDYPQSTRHPESYFYIAESYYYLDNALSAISYYAKTAEISYDSKLIIMAKISLGWSYLKLEKFKLARGNFESALQLSKKKGFLVEDVFLGLASLHGGMKNHREALDAYSQLIKNFPKSERIPESYLGKGNIYYALEDYPKAIAAYQFVIEQFPQTPQFQEIYQKAYFGLAWSNLKAGHFEKAIKNFHTIKNQTDNKVVKISALTQIGDAYQDVNQLERAIDIYDKILKNYPESPYADYVQYRQGIALLKMEKIEAATMSFQSLRANFPESKYLNDVNYYLGVAYFKKGDWPTAKEYIQKFSADLPRSHAFLVEAHYVLGLSEFNLGEYADAIKTFQKIAKNFPETPTMVKTAELNIAKCHYKMKDTKEALKKFRLLIAKYPASEVAQEALIWLGDHYLQTADYDNATLHYTQFLKDYPGSDKIDIVRFELGQVYEATEEFDKAINIYKLIDNTENRELYAKTKLAIADIFSKEFNPNSAIETYQNIIDASPEFKKDAYVKIADVYNNLKNYEKAITAYQNALKSDMELSRFHNAEVQFRIGDTYELLNDSNQAVEAYLKIPYLYADKTAWIIKAYLRIGRIFEDKEEWEQANKIYKKIIEYKTNELKFAQERIEWINEHALPGLLRH